MIHKKEIYVNAKQGVIFHKNATQSLPCKRYSHDNKLFQSKFAHHIRLNEFFCRLHLVFLVILPISGIFTSFKSVYFATKFGVIYRFAPVKSPCFTSRYCARFFKHPNFLIFVKIQHSSFISEPCRQQRHCRHFRRG